MNDKWQKLDFNTQLKLIDLINKDNEIVLSENRVETRVIDNHLEFRIKFDDLIGG